MTVVAALTVVCDGYRCRAALACDATSSTGARRESRDRGWIGGPKSSAVDYCPACARKAPADRLPAPITEAAR